MIALRMLGAHRGLLAALAVTALVIGALLVGVPGYLSGATIDATRSGLDALRGADGAYRVALDRATDADAQDAAVRRVIAGAADGAPLVVTRTLATDVPLTITVAGAHRAALIESDPGLHPEVRVVRGTWPTGDDQVAVQADAAADLHLAVGDTFTLRGVVLTVAALWRARDAEAPRFLGDAAIRAGRADGGAGPIVVDSGLWDRIRIDPLCRWTIAPDAPRTIPADLGTLGRLDPVLPTRLRDSRLGASGVEDDGDLSASVRTIDARVTAVLATAPVAAVVLVALAALALVQLARLLIGARERETLLLRSRGASTARLTGSAILEAGGIAGVCAAVGGAAAGLVAGTLTGIPVPWWAGAGGAVLVGLAGAVVLGGATLHAARAVLTRDVVTSSGRGRRAAALAAVAIAAALGSAQFLRDGGPLVLARGASGSDVRLDPLAAPAPALAVVAVALAAAALTPVVARLGLRLTRRRLDLAPLDLRRLRRSLASVGTAVVLVALASALLVVTAAHTATLDRATVRNRALLLGADVVATGASEDRLLEAARGLPDPSTLAAVRGVMVGSGTATLVGVPTDALTRAVTDGDGLLDRAALAREIRTTVPGPRLEADDRMLTGTLRATGLVPTDLDLRLLTTGDALLDVPATLDGDRFSAALPASASRLVAIDVTLPAVADSDQTAPLVPVTLALSDLATTRGAVDTGRAWAVPYVQPQPDRRPEPTGSLGTSFGTRSPSPILVRLMPEDSAPTPVVVTRSLAARTAVRPGSILAPIDEGQSLPVVVRGVADAVPGSSGPGFLIDLGALYAAELRVTEPPSSVRLWASGAASARSAALLTSRLPVTATVATAADGADRTTATTAAAALTAGTVGALVLAVIAVAAWLGAELRDRDGEVAVLRALGRDAEAQRRARARESGAVLLWGLAAGALGGLGVSVLLVPLLARAAVADPIDGLSVALHVDVVRLVGGLILLVAALAAVVLVTSARVRARARVALVEEVVR